MGSYRRYSRCTDIEKEKNYAEGVIDQIVKFSDARIKPTCDHFGACGGCKWQNLKYEAQLNSRKKLLKMR